MKKKINLQDLNKEELFKRYMKHASITKTLRTLLWIFCYSGIILGTITNSTIFYIIAVIGVNISGIAAGIFAGKRNDLKDEVDKRGLSAELDKFIEKESIEWQLKEPQINPVFTKANRIKESPFPEFENTNNKTEQNNCGNEMQK